MSLTSVGFDSLTPISITSSKINPFQAQKYLQANSRGSCTPEDPKPVVRLPSEGLFRTKGFVTEEQLANPELLDINGELCLAVLKDGCASDLTFGRYAGLESNVCNKTGVRSVEITVYNYDNQGKPFSSKGDSGSLIVNGKGEIVRLLHSGTRNV